MHVNLPNMHLNIFYIPMELFINSHAQTPLNKTEEPKENFDTSSSSALSVLPGKFSSWLLDSACCNHMTPYPSFFSHTNSARYAPTIHTANGSTMLVRSIGTVSTSKISISNVFHDPRTRQELGTDRRIGRLFENFSLPLPATSVSATSSSPSLSLWHSRLGHASSSQAPLNKTEEPKENFDTSLTLFVFSSYLPKFLYLFGEKLFSLLPMPSIIFQAQPFLIRLLMSAFLDLHLTINISDPLTLPVSSFFSLMNITNSSRVLAFVASLHRLFTEVSQFRPSFFLSSLSDLFPEVSTPSPELFPPSPEVSTSIPQIESSDHSFGLSYDVTPHSSPKSPARAPSEDPAPCNHTSPFLSGNISSSLICLISTVTLHEPHSYREASSNPLWQAAIIEELDVLSRNRTWDLVDLPLDQSVVGYKWVFKIKTRSDGSIEQYKAYLVALGFTKEYGIDYEETFTPVARLSSVRTLLAVAASRQWKPFQMDVKYAFLNGDLSEEVYMQPPLGLSHPPNKVCRLRRALYGLKQAPRAWFAKFSSTISRLGFSISSYDSTLFLRRTGKDTILLLLYVNDMIITGDDLSGIQELKDFLSQNFQMKDLGHLSYFLGLEITLSDDGFYLTQTKYTSDLLSRVGLTDHKIVDTPIKLNARLTPSSGELLPNPTLYRQLVSQFMSAPRLTHYAAVLRILRYLKGTIFHDLHFSAQSPLILRAYSDAD
uniref:Uncharacterized protein n=1 Tax=Fagus sylvatica TaxID=28930 RepID=A0A2N9HKY6_FAGSY